MTRTPLPLEPRTFLQVAYQKWHIDITWDGKSYLRWKAQSTVTGLFFTEGRRTVELDHRNGLEEECERVMDIITSMIPQERIVEYSKLKDSVKSGLRNLGYSKSSPPCELRVLEATEEVFRFGVYFPGALDRNPLKTHVIQATSGDTPEAIVEGIEWTLSEGNLSQYSIRNAASFKKKLALWVSRNVPVIELVEEDEESEYEWELTLFVTKGTREVSWEATQNDSTGYQGGILTVYEKVLLDRSEEEAEQLVRDVIEGDVVPKFGHVTNLKDVLERQVHEVIQELRQTDERI